MNFWHHTPYSRRGYVKQKARLGRQVRETVRKTWRNIIVPSRSIHENEAWKASFDSVN